MLRSGDTMTFLRAWLAKPLSVGAVAPSSKALACLMTSELKPSSGPVLELGPGTGVFTDALIRSGVQERELTLVELGVDFADILAVRYPHATVLRKNATDIFNHQTRRGRKYAVVISGLPLLSLPPRSVLRILARAFALSRDDTAFYQFTYGWRCPVPTGILQRLDLKADRIGTVFTNVPPASVYRIVRNATSLQTSA